MTVMTKKTASVMVTISSDALKSYLPTSLPTAAAEAKPANDPNDEDGTEGAHLNSKRKVLEPGEIGMVDGLVRNRSRSPQLGKQNSRTVILEVFKWIEIVVFDCEYELCRC